MTTAVAASRAGDVDRVDKLLRRHADRPRGLEWHLLQHTVAQPPSQVLKAHRGVVWQISVDPATGNFVTASDDGTLRWWDGESCQPLHTATQSGPHRVAAFVPGGPLLTGDNMLHAVGRSTGTPIGFPLDWQPHGLRALAVSADGSTAATMAMGDEYHVHDLSVLPGRQPAGETLRNPGRATRRIGHRPAFRAYRIDFTSEAGLLFYAREVIGDDGDRIGDRLVVWDVAEHQVSGQHAVVASEGVMRATIGAVDVSPDDRLAAVVGNYSIHLFDIQRRRWVGLVEIAEDAFDLEFSPDGRRLLCGLSGGRVAILGGIDPDASQSVGDMRVWQSTTIYNGCDSPVRSVAWLGDDRVATGHEDGRVVVIDLPQGPRPLWSGLRPLLAGDGSHLFCQSSDLRIDAYHLPPGQPAQLIESTDVPIDRSPHQPLLDPVIGEGCYRFDPGGKCFYFCIEHELYGWRLGESGAVLIGSHPRPASERSDINCLCLSPEGAFAATAASYCHEVRVWDTRSGRCVRVIDMIDNGMEVCFSPDGRFLFLSCPKQSRLLDMQSGKLRVLPIQPSTWVHWVDSDTLLCLHGAATLTQLDLPTGQITRRIRWVIRHPRYSTVDPVGGTLVMPEGDAVSIMHLGSGRLFGTIGFAADQVLVRPSDRSLLYWREDSRRGQFELFELPVE